MDENTMTKVTQTIAVLASSPGGMLLNALRFQYKAAIEGARATVNVYVAHPVAIGEHPQHMEEIDKLLDIISTNQDKLDVLNTRFPEIQNDYLDPS